MNTWLFVTGLAGALLVILIIAGCAISWAVLELARKRKRKTSTTTTTMKENHNDNLADQV